MSTALERKGERVKRYIDKQKGKLMPAPIKKAATKSKKPKGIPGKRVPYPQVASTKSSHGRKRHAYRT